MSWTHNINNKMSPPIQTALDRATKGHQIKHERRYSFKMMSIPEKEEDHRLKLIFVKKWKTKQNLMN